MSERLPILVAVLFTLAGNAAWAQDGAVESEAETDRQATRQAAIRSGLNASISSFCLNAPETDQAAMTVQVEDLPATALSSGAAPAGIGQPVGVGAYLYRGKGVRITSNDPRFDALLIDPILFVPTLPSGDQLATWNLVHAKGGGPCRLAFAPPAPPERGLSVLAAGAAARAQLPGHHAGASWRFGRDRFIGLMHPEGQVDRTVIVTFSSGQDHKTRVEAEAPLALQGIRAMPPLHGGPWSVFLIGRQADGSMVQAVLEAQPPGW